MPPRVTSPTATPLPFAALASQKNYMSLYIMTTYAEGRDEQWFRKEWAKTGKKLDMGKCCIRFKRLEDLALDVIGDAIRRMPVKTHIERYEAIMKAKPHPEQGFRACLGILRLARSFGPARLEAACRRGNEIGATTYGSIASILKNGLDKAYAAEPTPEAPPIRHGNIRGTGYYH